MKIDTALILCAGFGKRLNPLTLETPKPLLTIKNISILERCINLIIKLNITKVYINTFHLGHQISDFIRKKNFPIKIEIIEDGNEILNTGGGVLNMINCSESDDFIIFNPDTLWNEDYIIEIKKMEEFYFMNKLNNVLLIADKDLSFDKNFKGDFNLRGNLLLKSNNKKFIYIGCQILNKDLFEKYRIKNFPIYEIWDKLIKKEQLYGFKSLNKFYHLTNLEIFKKLKDF